MTTRHLHLPRRIVTLLEVNGGSYIYRRNITQKIRDAAYAWESDGEFWWHQKDGKKLKPVKPHFCDAGDDFIVLYRGQPIADSTLRLVVVHVTIDRRYSADGWHGETANRRWPKLGWTGYQVVDNPWAWIVTCNVSKKGVTP